MAKAGKKGRGKKPKDSETREPSVAVAAVQGTFNFLSELAGGLLDRKVTITALITLPTAFVFYVGLLPEEQRGGSFAEVGDVIANVLSSSWVTLSGWGVFSVYLAASVVFFKIQDNRIKKQGAEISRLRDLENSNRLSTRIKPQILAEVREQRTLGPKK